MSEKPHRQGRRPFHWLRQKLVAGVLTLAPLAVTFWLLRQAIGFLDSLIGKYLVKYLPVAAKVPGLGLVALFLLLLLTGTLVRSYLGRRFFNLYDGILQRIPIARTVYISVKQLVEAFTPGSESRSFREVALVEYPRPGIYALTFVTAQSPREFRDQTGDDLITVFLPTSPNPTSGYCLLVPRDQLYPISMGVEEATKFIISAGIIGNDPDAVSGAPLLTGAQAEELKAAPKKRETETDTPAG